jgi:hypothetical protein
MAPYRGRDVGFVGLPTIKEVSLAWAKTAIRHTGALSSALRRKCSLATCNYTGRYLAKGSTSSWRHGAISGGHPMKIVIILDIGRIAIAIALILQLLK